MGIAFLSCSSVANYVFVLFLRKAAFDYFLLNKRSAVITHRFVRLCESTSIVYRPAFKKTCTGNPIIIPATSFQIFGIPTPDLKKAPQTSIFPMMDDL